MKNSSKKISIILPDLSGGGTERMRIHLAEKFIQKGYEVEFVLFQKRGELLKLVPDEASIADLNVLKFRSSFFPLIKYINRERPDAVLAAMWPVTVIAIWATKCSLYSPTIVVSEHNQISSTAVYKQGKNGFNKWLIPFSMKVSYPHANTVVGVSRGVVEELKNLSNLTLSNLVTIYNPAAPDRKEVESIVPDGRFWESAGSKKIIAIGSLKKQKNYPNLIRAFENVLQKTEAELLILGEGNERAILEKMIKDKGIDHAVHMPGFVHNPLPYLKSADLFVLSSAWEGFGNVIVEALACGVPVVSTDCKSGPAEILENGKYGTMVPVSNFEALAKAIVDNLNKQYDPDFLKTRAKDFEAGKIANAYLELLFPLKHK